MCLQNEPTGDLIRPCGCSGSVRLVHRECLDNWRSLSPHPDALVACELCKSKYRLILQQNSSDCWRKFRYTAAVILDLTLFIAIFMGMYLFVGWIGDLSITPWLKNIKVVNQSMPFLNFNLWSGRIWFWGFIVFFFILGIVGSIVYCCFKGDEGSHSYESQYNHSSCWWIFCGPSYYNGYYYYSPYGYWGPGDILCWYWLLTPHYHYHGVHTTCCDCGSGSCAGCAGMGNSCSGNDCSKDGLIALLVIVIIVVLIFVIIGVVIGSMITFLLVNKIMKRHLTLLERQSHTQKFIVCNLDNPEEVNEADAQERDGTLAPFSEVLVINYPETQEPLNRPPKSKEFDLY